MPRNDVPYYGFHSQCAFYPSTITKQVEGVTIHTRKSEFFADRNDGDRFAAVPASEYEGVCVERLFVIRHMASLTALCVTI